MAEATQRIILPGQALINARQDLILPRQPGIHPGQRLIHLRHHVNNVHSGLLLRQRRPEPTRGRARWTRSPLRAGPARG